MTGPRAFGALAIERGRASSALRPCDDGRMSPTARANAGEIKRLASEGLTRAAIAE
jgi:hypothetical protein